MKTLKQILLEQKMSPHQCLQSLGFTKITDNFLGTVYTKNLDYKFFTSKESRNDLLYTLMFKNPDLREYIFNYRIAYKMLGNDVPDTKTLTCIVNKNIVPQTINFSLTIPTKSLKKSLIPPLDQLIVSDNFVKKHNFIFKDCNDLNQTIINQLNSLISKSGGFSGIIKKVINVLKSAQTIKPADDRKAIKYKSGTPYGSGVKGYGGRL